MPIISVLNSIGLFENVTDVILINKYIRIKCSVQDWVQQLIYFFGKYIYESKQIDFWISSMKENEVILDIGANVGYYSLLASLKTDSIIYCFEPNPDIYSRLVENINLNASQNIISLNKGVSRCSEELKFYVSDNNNSGMSSLTEPLNYSGKSINVNVLSIDEFILEYNIKGISKIKIDVEGNEFNVLLGMKSMLEENKPQIFIEIYELNLIRFKHHNIDVYNFLRSIGYNSYEIDDLNNLTYYDDFRDNSLAIFLIESR